MAAEPAPPEIVELDPDSKAALRLWTKSARCWRVGFAGPEGLDWTQLKVLADALQVELDEAVIIDLQALEDETLTVLDEQRRRADATKKQGR